jgi:soluble lytic murein transglycosylase-like protein
MNFRKQIGYAVMILMLATTSFAADLAVLRNGFSIPHERREQIGTITRLYLSIDGTNYADVPTEQIDRFEKGPPTLPAPTIQAAPAAMATPAPTISLDQAIAAGSQRYRIDPDLISSVIRAESNFNARAISPKGAQGLMQLMPNTASKLGVANPFDPQANVDGGTKYLRELIERYNFDLVKALAAYNAGPHRVEQYGGVPPYRETRAYVARIVRDFNKKKLAQQKLAQKSQPAKNLPPKSLVAAKTNKPSTVQTSGK